MITYKKAKDFLQIRTLVRRAVGDEALYVER